MLNPFAEERLTDAGDRELVESVLAGHRWALEELILRHQAWIYNIAFRMVWHPQDAEDVTQEILIKVITALSSFKGDSSFRTWLYRIVANHVINMKKRRSEILLHSFDTYGREIDETPDYPLPDPAELPVEMNLIVEETQISCMTGMLLCLDRKHRLAFILGSIFGVTDVVGSEVMDISRSAFRQRLSRARRKLTNFMNEKCGLMKEDNPCHCTRKTKALVDLGHVDPANLLFSSTTARSVKSIAQAKVEKLDSLLESCCQELFREHPFQESPDFVHSFRKIIDSSQFQEIIHFGDE